MSPTIATAALAYYFGVKLSVVVNRPQWLSVDAYYEKGMRVFITGSYRNREHLKTCIKRIQACTESVGSV